MCVAVDASGHVMHATKPLSGVKGWSKPVRVDTAMQPGGGYAGFSAVACPTTKLCIAVDNAANGQVAYTTDPTGPASAWTLATVANGVTLDSAACASATLCVIGGSERFYSINPTGGASAWKAAGSLSGSVAVMAALTCNGLKLCIGVGYGNAGAGLASASSTPTGGAVAWIGSAIGSDPPDSGRRTGRWRQLSGAQLLRGRRRRLERVHELDTGAWWLERGEASEEGIAVDDQPDRLQHEALRRGRQPRHRHLRRRQGWVDARPRRRRRPRPRPKPTVTKTTSTKTPTPSGTG